jgi:hypothetical protein
MWFEKEAVPVTASVIAAALAKELRATAALIRPLDWARAKPRKEPAFDDPGDEGQAADVQFSNGGRLGMLAAQHIAEGEIIDEAPVVVLPRRDARILALTDVFPYLEDWPLEGWEVALPLGHVAMYRSGAEPNAKLVKRLETMVLEVVALRTIEAGDEIVVSRAPRHTVVATAAEARWLRLEARLRLRLKKGERYYLRRGS